MNRLFTKRIQKELAICRRDNFTYPNLYVRPLESDLKKWYFLVYNLVDTDFDGGVYFGVMTLPDEYPIKAPDFKFFTPNGRFETGRKICTDFTAFHQSSYSSSQTIVTMLHGVVSFMTDPQFDSDGRVINDTTGVGGIKTDSATKKQLAAKSIAWNKSDPLYQSVFGDFNVTTLTGTLTH